MKTKSGRRAVAAAVVACLGLMLVGTVARAEAEPLAPINRVLGLKNLLAGHDLNGVSLNGAVLDESQLAWVSATDAELDGKLLELVSVSNSKVVGYDNRGHFVAHNKMVGAIFTAALDDGEEIDVRIDDVYRSSAHYDKDTYLYEVSYETDDGWLPLCGVDELDEPIAAIALEGRWDFSAGTETGGSHVDDESAFTFACRGYVIAKCVEAGYKPWKKAMVCTPGEGCRMTTLAAHHQACTRMLRADYCGDGISHTVDATPVNFYDDFGVRYDSEEWSVEAEWDEDGAICAVTERISGDAPACVDWLADVSCGDPDHLADGALLISEIVPALD
jgi:hypothetical protein